MTLFEAIVLGVVQGLTEFLPISSTAHLRIVPALLGWDDPGAPFSAVIQIGTLLAVLSYFSSDIWRIVRAVLADLMRFRFASTHDARLGWMIAAGTVPIVVCGLLLQDMIRTTLRSLWVISASMIGLALALIAAECVGYARQRRGEPGREMQQLGWLDAAAVGLSQALALIPGASRSGVTIMGGLFCGMTRATAARFSFLLSLPAIFAAGMLELYKARHELLASQSDVVALLTATAVSAIVGYAAIAVLLSFLRTHTTWSFIIYRLIVGFLLIGLLAAGRLQAM